MGQSVLGYAPNITGNITLVRGYFDSATGVFVKIAHSAAETGTNWHSAGGVNFDASRSLPVYAGSMYGDRIVPAAVLIPGFIIKY